MTRCSSACSCYLQLGLGDLPGSREGADLENEPLSFRRCPVGGASESWSGERGGALMLLDLDGREEVEELETLSEPALVRGEEAPGGAAEEEDVVLEEDLGEELGPVVRVCLKEEEAVFWAKLGSSDDEEDLCRGVLGALTLPPPPP